MMALRSSSWDQISLNAIEMNCAKCLLCEISIYCTGGKKCCLQELVCQLAAKNALPGNPYTTIDLREREREWDG